MKRYRYALRGYAARKIYDHAPLAGCAILFIRQLIRYEQFGRVGINFEGGSTERTASSRLGWERAGAPLPRGLSLRAHTCACNVIVTGARRLLSEPTASPVLVEVFATSLRRSEKPSR